jgi:hypothetical protein
VIDLRTYAPDRYPVAPCQPKARLAVVEERVSPPVEQPMHVAAQRRDPVWIIAVKAVGQVDKAIAVAPAAERGHFDTATFRRLPLGCWAGIGSLWRARSEPRHARAIHQHWNEDAASLKMCQAPNSGGYNIRDRTVSKNRASKKWLVPRPFPAPRTRRF